MLNDSMNTYLLKNLSEIGSENSFKGGVLKKSKARNSVADKNRLVLDWKPGF